MEVEYRVKKEEVPPLAQQWIQEAFGSARSVRWYVEESSGKESFEAKLKKHHLRYSVEFSKSGELEDVEIKRKLKEVPAALQQALKEIDGFQLQRLQEQWTGSPDLVLQAVQAEKPIAVQTLYEVEFVGRLKGEKALWEGTFSPQGELLSYRHIILRPDDNLNF